MGRVHINAILKVLGHYFDSINHRNFFELEKLAESKLEQYLQEHLDNNLELFKKKELDFVNYYKTELTNYESNPKQKEYYFALERYASAIEKLQKNLTEKEIRQKNEENETDLLQMLSIVSYFEEKNVKIQLFFTGNDHFKEQGKTDYREINEAKKAKPCVVVKQAWRTRDLLHLERIHEADDNQLKGLFHEKFESSKIQYGFKTEAKFAKNEIKKIHFSYGKYVRWFPILEQWFDFLKIKSVPSKNITNTLNDLLIAPSYQLPPLKDERTFENLLCDLFNCIEKTSAYTNNDFQIFGRKGQTQKGIDIFSAQTKTVVQCKLKDVSKKSEAIRKSLIDDINTDLTKTSTLTFSFDRFIIASTHKDDAIIQEYLTELQQKLHLNFTLYYWGWDTISRHIEQHEIILSKYFPQFKPKVK